MLKGLHLPSAVIGSITAKSKNNGVGFRISTPELSKDELNAIFDLQDQVCDILIQPQDEEFPEIQEVKSEVERKTASSRLRGALFVLHQKSGSDIDFAVYYQQQMDKFIDKVKEKIQEYE